MRTIIKLIIGFSLALPITVLAQDEVLVIRGKALSPIFG
jgi:hypothetical protein